MPKPLTRIEIDVSQQRLKLMQGSSCVRQYSVSTALNGVGQESGSGQTPLGLHCIRAKIGRGQDPRSVFVARRPTGELYTDALAARFIERDWILGRILWLSGCERGKNRLGSVDSMRRYIYIHGTPDTEPMGQALSHGCVRMRMADVCELFDLVECGSRVEIVESAQC